MTSTLISKLLGIGMGGIVGGVVLFGNLNGCYNKYNLDGEIVKYNKDLASPLEIRTKDSVFTYVISKDNRDSVDAVYVYPCSSKGCRISEMQTYNKFGKGKEKINEFQKRFTNYLNKINLIENKNKE